jgi:hypothetical protein
VKIIFYTNLARNSFWKWDGEILMIYCKGFYDGIVWVKSAHSSVKDLKNNYVGIKEISVSELALLL